MDVRPALLHEQPAIRSLLTAAELPLEDLATADVRFLVAMQDDEPVAAIGLESFEGAGLLRSLVVRADLRGSGIGGQLVDALESLARQSGMDRLVLLTQTAAPFFQRRGYRAIDRDEAPDSIRSSAQFRSLCPASATCMTKPLDPTR